MKINWKVRFKNPVFLFQIVLAIFVPILAYMGLTLEDLVTWVAVFEVVLEAVRNPYVLSLVIVSVWNAVNDPIVSGLSDSKQGLGYNKPKEDSKYIR